MTDQPYPPAPPVEATGPWPDPDDFETSEGAEFPAPPDEPAGG